MQSETEDDLTLATDKPNVSLLKDAYDKTIEDLSWYIEGCEEGYKWRRNMWGGKSRDLRKHGPDAFPWDGASDAEAQVVSVRIKTYVDMFMAALQRANVRAYPVEAGDLQRSQVTSSFLKWMISSYIPQFKRHMELAANNLMERGIAVTYVGWEKEAQTYKQRLTLEQVAALSPDLVRLILEKGSDQQLMELLKQQFGGMTDRKAKKALNDLRKTGEAEFTIVRQSVDRPYVEDLAPDSEFFFPAYTTDYQAAPYCFWRVPMTAQDIRNRVATAGWDSDWAEYVIERCAGNKDLTVTAESSKSETAYGSSAEDDEVYEIIYAYQRLTDPDDNSQGIYCTIFCPSAVGERDAPEFAKHELMNGIDDYPVVVTKLSEDDKRLYEVITFPELLRSAQLLVKNERDARVDRNSLANMPPLQYPVGTPPPEWGPGIKIPYRRQNEIAFGAAPAPNPGSVEMEVTQLREADDIAGLNAGNPLSTVRQQALVNKFLEHVANVIKMAFKCYQRFGPDAVFFRVTGNPNPERFQKGNPDENFDIVINFDVLNNDPETAEKRLNAFASLFQFDKNGLINVNAWLAAAAGSIDPILADSFLQPAEAAQQEVQKNVTDDLSKIYAGIEVGARPNGAQIALQIIQQYTQQQDVMARLQQDEAFRMRIEKYAKQYAFQMQQAQNAQIGRIGTQPAQMGSVNTQAVQQ